MVREGEEFCESISTQQTCRGGFSHDESMEAQ